VRAKHNVEDRLFEGSEKGNKNIRNVVIVQGFFYASLWVALQAGAKGMQAGLKELDR